MTVMKTLSRRTQQVVLAAAITGLGVSAAQAGLTVDLRLTKVDGTPVTVVGNTYTPTHVGQTLTYDVYAVAAGVTGSNVQLQSLQGSFRSTGTGVLGNIAPAGDNLILTKRGGIPLTGGVVAGVGLFTANGSQPGASYGAAGDQDLGSANTDAIGSGGFVVMRATSPVPGTTVGSNTEWLVGRVTFNVTSLGSGGTTVAFYPRANASNAIVPQSALWRSGPLSTDVKDGTNGIATGLMGTDPAPSQWITNTPGNWSDTANWYNSFPSGAGSVALFGAVGNGAAVTIDGAGRTVGTITFDCNHTYDLRGPGTLTLNNSGAPALIDLRNSADNHTISAPLSIPADTIVNRTGLPTSVLTISGPQSHGTNSVFNAMGGTTNFNADLGSTSAHNVSVNISNAGTVVNFGGTGSQHLAALNIPAGGKAAITLTGSNALNNSLDVGTGGLAITGTGQLDLGRSGMVLRHNDSDFGLAKQLAVTALVKSGMGPAMDWVGPGITSSAAALDAQDLAIKAVGVMNNDDGEGGVFLYSNFMGQAVDNKAILARYTYYGDANLDGQVTPTDLVYYRMGLNSHGTLKGWQYGDFDYSGGINPTDLVYYRIGLNGSKTTPLSGGSQSVGMAAVAHDVVVPEPSTLGVLALGAVGLLARRQSRVHMPRKSSIFTGQIQNL